MERICSLLALWVVITGCGGTTHNPEELELVVFHMVNNHRTDNGVAELKWAVDIADLARRHSQDMVNRDFFDHTNPDGQNVSGRLALVDIDVIAAGENIARCTKNTDEPARSILTAWQESTVHKDTMENATYQEAGVGCVIGDDNYLYFTQVFIARE